MNKHKFLEKIDSGCKSFSDVEFIEIEVEGSVFNELTCSGCRFTSCSFKDCEFTSCSFKDCDFFENVFENCLIMNCRFNGASFIGSKLSGSYQIVDFSSCDFRFADLRFADLDRVDLSACNLTFACIPLKHFCVTTKWGKFIAIRYHDMKCVPRIQIQIGAAIKSLRAWKSNNIWGRILRSEPCFAHIEARKCFAQLIELASELLTY